ncbi:MAG TPA: TlpA disulfide reductase family protein [Saprospiraceae bacterium]|mgnify:FL=1|nr:TlpA disulfide reductase family protein [Saprospiraceae bacterium]
MTFAHSIYTILVVILFSSCSRYPVSGHIDMVNSQKKPVIYLIDPVNFGSLLSSFEGKVIDSTTIDQKGNFQFTKMPASSEKKLYVITIQKHGEKYPTKLENDVPDSSNYIPFVFQAQENIKINSVANQLTKNASIESKTTDNQSIIKLIQNRSLLYGEYKAKSKIASEDQLLEAEKAKLEFQKSLIESVQNDKSVFVTALALRWISPNGDYERLPELVKSACLNLTQNAPDHLWTQQICAKSASLSLTAGDQFPDFPMPMKNLDTISLHSLLADKLTLIDLWASWCAPCRQENRNILVPLWDKYHQNGFQIIGYALDSSDKGWNNAISKDGADRWLHASHLQGDVSPLFDLLKISTIPANYLVNKEGIVLAKNLHGVELTAWVDNYMKK